MIALLAIGGLARAAAGTPATPIVEYNLETDDGGFDSTGETGQWQWGVVAHGPDSGFDGAHAWSTGLTTDYLNDAVDYLEIPVPDLSNAAHPALRLLQWYDIAAGDRGWFEVDRGDGWVMVPPVYGYPTAGGFSGSSGWWVPAVVDLTGADPGWRVRLAFATDLAGVASGWTVDAVGFYDGDVAPPWMGELTELDDTEKIEGPFPVSVSVADDTVVTAVTLYWSVGAGDETPVAMVPGPDGRWKGEIPGQPPNTIVRYRVEASDGVNGASLPAGSPRSFRVYLPAPEGLLAPTGRVIDTTATLTWSPPETERTVLGYAVYRGETEIDRVEGLSATVPLMGEGDTFAVRAMYAAGTGDPSESVTVDAVVPTIVSIEPADAFPGDSLRVTLRGSYLLLADGDVTPSFGEGIDVDSVEIRDVDTAVVRLHVADDAEAGDRAVTVATSNYTLVDDDAFTVGDAADRPRLTGMDPESVHQGEEADLVIGLVGDLAGVPTVDLGEGVVVESVDVAGDELHVRVACASDANIGTHAVLVDDGVRIFDGASLEVKDAVITPGRACGTTDGRGAPVGAMAWALAAVAIGRRRSR